MANHARCSRKGDTRAGCHESHRAAAHRYAAFDRGSAINALLTCGKGQRIGLFARAGIGKSMALGMMTRLTQADVNVVALVGERGREVNEFIERELGAASPKAWSWLRPATARDCPRSRCSCCGNHCRILSRPRQRRAAGDGFANAVGAGRAEIGLAAESRRRARLSPVRLPRLAAAAQHCGRTQRGSITAFYSVLAEGDDPNEPISDAVRGLLDGHIWLSRKLAAGVTPRSTCSRA